MSIINFVATFANMQKFIAETLPDQFDVELAQSVLCEEFQAMYEDLHALPLQSEVPVDTSHPLDFAQALEVYMPDKDDNLRDQFRERYRLHKKLGLDEDYLGNGLTKNKIPGSPNRFGAVSMFMFEQRPMTVDRMQEAGVIRVIGSDQMQPVRGEEE